MQIPALTIRQPWAHLIAEGRKRFEVRGWRPTGVTLRIGDRLAIHAATTVGAGERELLSTLFPAGWVRRNRTLGGGCIDTLIGCTLPLGAVVATATLAGVWRVLHADSRRVVCVWRAGDGQPCPAVLPDWMRLERDQVETTVSFEASPHVPCHPGVYLWQLDDVRRVTPPCPRRGTTGLWTIRAPEILDA